MTDEGTETLAAMRPIRNRASSEHLAGEVSPEEAEALSDVLGRVSASVRNELEGRGRSEI